MEEIRTMKETTFGLDQWAPVDLKPIPKVACKPLVEMMNMVGEGEDWPGSMKTVRAAFMAKEEGIDLDPLSYRPTECC